PLPQDAWGVDVVVCGSQKGLMVPPGLASVSIAPWAAASIERGLPRFYFDLRKARKSAPLGESAFTPAVSLVLALEEALAMIREEGLAEVHLRHRRLAHATGAPGSIEVAEAVGRGAACGACRRSSPRSWRRPRSSGCAPRDSRSSSAPACRAHHSPRRSTAARRCWCAAPRRSPPRCCG